MAMRIFYSYSHSDQDKALRDELEKQLTVLKQNVLITDWHDGEISAGTEWDAEIKKNLNAADIILLLVSADFLASDYIRKVELKQAIERHEAGKARVIPIILRTCDWKSSTLGKLQALPKDGKAITKWPDQDEAFLDVVNGIRKALETPMLPKVFSLSSALIPNPPIEHNWVGREDANAQLQTWISDPTVTLIGLQGLGGVGKSALAAHIYNTLREGTMPLPPSSSPIHNSAFKIQNFQWADVSQKPDFVAFAEGIVLGMGGKIIQAGDNKTVMNQLINFLDRQPCLLVVDNLETLLTEAEGWQDSGYEMFFSRWIEQGRGSTLLLTTREKPNLFQGWEYWYSLEGLKPKNGAKLLQVLKVKGTETALETFAQSMDGHPLTLQLVAGFLREYCGGELSRVDELGLLQEELIFEEAEGRHHEKTDARLSWILDQHLQHLTDQERRFLFNLTVYRQPFGWAAAVWMWEDLIPLSFEGRGETDSSSSPLAVPSHGSGGSPFVAGDGLGERPTVKRFQILKELVQLRNRSLLLEIGDSRFQFQFLIQRYLRQILVRPYSQQPETDFSLAHQQALKYYLDHLKPKPWHSLDDVNEYMEACYHHCQLQQYAQAYEIVERCHTFLNLQGDNKRLVEVYGTLTRDWQPESMEDKDKWAWAWTRQGHAYYSMGEFRSAIQCQRQAQQVFCDICNRRGEARALRSLGDAYVPVGEHKQAIKFFQQCLGICRGIRQRQEEMIALRGLGNAYFYLADYRRAIRLYEKSLVIAKEISDPKGKASALNWLGNAFQCLGEYRKAIDFHQQSLTIRKEIGDRAGESNSLSNSGNGYYLLGEYQEAIRLYQQSLPIRREIGDRDGEANSLDNMGNAYHSLGEYRRAIDLHQQSLAIRREIGNREGEATSLNNLGYGYSSLKDYDRAIILLQQAVETFKEIGSGYGRADALTRLGKAYNSLGQPKQAIEFHQQALNITKEIEQRDVETDAYCGLGDAYCSLEQYTEARKNYQQSLDIAKAINYRRGEADSFFNLGLVLFKLTSSPEAVAALINARQLYQEMGLVAKVQECDNEISKADNEHPLR